MSHLPADAHRRLERASDGAQPEPVMVTRLAFPQSNAIQQVERAWLVEWRFNGVQWLYLTGGSFNFTSDANKALHFARREDAEAALAWAQEFDRRRGLRPAGQMLTTEHEWISAPLPPAALLPAERACCGTFEGSPHRATCPDHPPAAHAEAQAAAPVSRWEGAEEWMPLAWALCADECGEDACSALVWEGGPIPEPWGERWLKYEGEAQRLIALVRKHVPGAAPPPQDEPDTLRDRLQRQCTAWGAYWRAPDAHGVDLSIDQALALLGDALGVEVTIKAPAERAPLTHEQILACVRSVGLPAPMGLTRDRGPYEVTEPTWFLIQLVRAIERAHGVEAATAQQAKG